MAVKKRIKTSKYIGVSYVKQRRKFRATITLWDKERMKTIKKQLGCFLLEREAAMAYDLAAVVLGKKTNFLKKIIK